MVQSETQNSIRTMTKLQTTNPNTITVRDIFLASSEIATWKKRRLAILMEEKHEWVLAE